MITLIRPRGFCSGVKRAIETVEKALEKFGSPVYLNHPIVHNSHVIKRLEEKGAIFVKDIKEIPEGAVVIFSAHGTSPQIRKEIKANTVIDATVPSPI